MEPQILSISQINEYIRTQMDGDRLLSGLSVRGEISNYKVYPSGHHYFTIKDENAALRCVMFRSSAVSLKFKPENGMKVVASGKITVYPRDGAYQLYCSRLILDGVGDLYVAFELLKKKLAAEGLFEREHKKPIPRFPGTIGIVTSSAGAAVHDMLRILRKRYPLSQVRLLPVRVQGAEAPVEIAGAIRYANYFHLADLLIVGRGGGSIEDLWAFNDEDVAHAIYESEIPVISAVGHEPDVTISDYVADLRAATPSNAAELAVPDQDALRQTLDNIHINLYGILDAKIKNAKKQLQILSARPALQSPTQYIDQRRKSLELLQRRLVSSQVQLINRYRQRFLSNTAKLDAMSPLKVLTRGYAMVQTEQGNVLQSIHQIDLGQTLDITIHDGKIRASVVQIKENVQ